VTTIEANKQQTMSFGTAEAAIALLVLATVLSILDMSHAVKTTPIHSQAPSKPWSARLKADARLARANNAAQDVAPHNAQSISPPYCDSAANCQAGSTCCVLANGKPGCFPGVNDTCCGINDTACPQGDVCDPIQNQCAPVDNSTLCSGCTYVVDLLDEYGCNYACHALPPPFGTICHFIVSATSLCERILNWTTHGVGPEAICAELSFCGGGSCKCSYCSVYAETRCLSLPNKCPDASQTNALPAAFREQLEDSGADDSASANAKQLCIDGACNNSTLGCCLTCF
jgi:hypothetical protein